MWGRAEIVGGDRVLYFCETVLIVVARGGGGAIMTAGKCRLRRV